jgi:predicted DNA-binding transcriptional regulator YafY
MADASQKKLRQMLELLIMLSSKYGRTKKTLSEHFGTSTKTIERYLDTFRDVGLVVDKNQEGYIKINKEESDYKDLSELLHFSEEESGILSNAIDSIEATSGLKEQLKKKLYSIYNFDRVATPLVKKHNQKIVEELSQAITAQKQVRLINYSSSSSQNISDRLVEPFNFTQNYTSLWAYEPLSDTNKTFKINRISKIKMETTDFMFADKHHKNDLDVFRMSGDSKTEIKLLLTVKAYNLLIEEYPSAEKYISKLKNDKFELLTEITNLKGVGRFVLGLPLDVSITYPQDLKDYVRSEMEKGLRKLEE